MRSFVQVLTTPTADTPGTSLLLHFDNKRYLIGSLAEGTQRAGIEVGARLLKVSACFITGRTEWSNIGGLVGMILTLADSTASSQASSLEDALYKVRTKALREGWSENAEKMREVEEEVTKEHKSNSILTLFGPPNLNYMLATGRRYIFRKGMPLQVHEIREPVSHGESKKELEPFWADENVKVWALPVLPTLCSPPSQTEGDITSPRSSDSTNGDNTLANGAPDGQLTPQERDLLTVKAVVSEMFDSSWRLDTFHETKLSQVRMPATIFIRNPETNKVERYHGPLPGGEHPLQDPDLKVLARRPWPGALVESLPQTEPAKEAISYIIRNHVQRGKFRKDKAIEHKVEQGKKWSQLASGQSVTNADGITITPDQVLGPSKDGGGIAVIDLPDSSYIDNLISRQEWQDPKVMAGVAAMIWICGKDVAVDSRVQEFMKLHSDLQHVISSPDYCPNHISMDSSAASTIRLRKIDPVRYRIPVHDNECPLLDERKNLMDGVSMAARGQIIQLEPSFELQDSHVMPQLAIDEVEKALSEEILDEAAKAHHAIESDKENEFQWASDIPDGDAEIITLGTGSALPSKYRNVSATLLRVPGWGSMLFDCGENTLGQLKRVLDPDELRQVLRDLRIIFISHMHADHQLGTVGVIKAWYREVHNGQPASSDSHLQSMLNDQKRLAVISEPAMLHWLTEYASVEDYGFSRIAPLLITPHERTKMRRSKLGWFLPPMEFAGLTPQERMEKHASNTVPASAPYLRLEDIQAVAVQHCHGARAVSVTFPSGLKVSYSGDCRPSSAFAHIGKGSHVCIHEATFDDELQMDAEAKNHSTTSEALGVAQRMGAKACVLTHFSQRYQKLPVLEYSGGNGDGDGKDVAQDLSTSDVEDAEEDADPEMATEGPLEDTAVTMPDQVAGKDDGQQYDIASKRGGKRRAFEDAGPSAVKLKVSSDMRVAVAFDYMRVKVGEIGQLEKFTPTLLKLFAEEDNSEKSVATAPSESKKSKKDKKKGATST